MNETRDLGWVPLFLGLFLTVVFIVGPFILLHVRVPLLFLNLLLTAVFLAGFFIIYLLYVRVPLFLGFLLTAVFLANLFFIFFLYLIFLAPPFPP